MGRHKSSFITMYTYLWVSVLVLLKLRLVESHGFLKTPRSRNWVAYEEGVDSQGDANAGKPQREYCPHCLNVKLADNLCGKGNAATHYDRWNDVNGNRMPWMSQATYDEGDEIVVEVALSTNHAGHMEMWLCDMGDDSDQDCLWSHPAKLVKDEIFDGPVDPTYPERAYFAPNSSEFKFTYKLPDGLTGDNVLVQWRYITANSCIPPGYRDTEVGERLKELGWLRSLGMGDCVPPYDPTGARSPTDPEQFWNCAEITINKKKAMPPTYSPQPTPPTYSPQPTPPTTSNPSNNPTEKGTSRGYCNYGNDGTGDTSTCDGDVEGGEWCNESQDHCEGYCNGKWCTNGKNTVSPKPSPMPKPTSAPQPLPAGVKPATTTRYWDCSGGSCGCAYLPLGPDPTYPAHCHSNAMFAAPLDNPYGAKFYGTAAVSEVLFGENSGGWLGTGCGKCYKVTGTSNTRGYEGVETTLVLKAANFCPPENAACSGNKAHFDIAAPGFDVIAYSFSHVCPEREEDEKEGFAACSNWLIHDNDPDNNCDCSLFKSQVLRDGCSNFLSLQWDNAPVVYEEVECPDELSRLPCWEENGNNYPPFPTVPEFCASNIVSDATLMPSDSPSNEPPPVPTFSPIAKPTFSPIAKPTISPIANPSTSPTVAPSQPTGGGDPCCSQNFKTCPDLGEYCNESEANCKNCGGIFIYGAPLDCIARYDACTNDTDGCCPPAICKGNNHYAQCLS